MMALTAISDTTSTPIRKHGLPTLLISTLTLFGALYSETISADTTVFAQSNKDCNLKSGFKSCSYVAGGLVLSSVSPDGEAGGWSTSSESSTGFNLSIGHHFKPRIFGEFTYSDLGEAKLTNSSSAITGTESISYSTASIHAGYLFKDPKETFNTYVKAGLSGIQNSASSSRIPYSKQNTILPSIGAGIQWQSPTSGLFVRAGGDYHSSDALAFNIQAGYKFDFFGKNQTTTQTKPKPRRAVKKQQPRRVVKKTITRKPAVKKQPQLRHIISSIVKQPDFAGVLNGVDFKPNTAILTRRAEFVLKGIARHLKKQPKMRVEILGHTDSLGITSKNLLLSKTRASSVRAFLILEGINGRRMTAEGVGDSQPRATNSTEHGRRANRRIELRAL